MNEGAPHTEPTLSQILYALALALAPFIESLIAEAQRQGRPITPGLRRMAKIAAAFRALANLCGTPAAASAAPAAPRPRPHTPPSRPAPHARRVTPRPAAIQARRHPATPQLLRTARL